MVHDKKTIENELAKSRVKTGFQKEKGQPVLRETGMIHRDRCDFTGINSESQWHMEGPQWEMTLGES